MQKAPDQLTTNRSAGQRRPGLRQFGCDRSGASALEFALLAVPTILLLLAILQIGLVFFATFALEHATSQGARLIRTGQAQSQGFDAAAFKTEVCKVLTVPLSCAGLQAGRAPLLEFRQHPDDQSPRCGRRHEDEFRL